MSTGAYDPRREAARTMAWYLLAAIPASVLTRLGVEAFRGTQAKPKVTGIGSEGYRLPIDMPVVPKEKEEKEAMEKEASNFVKTIHQKLSDFIYNTFSSDSFMGGGDAKSPGGVPWFLGAGVPAGVATLAGGWAGTDKLLSHTRRSEKRKDRAAAKSEYERLLGLAVQEARPKRASALDAITELSFNKEGNILTAPWEGAKHYGGGGLGILAALTLLTALTSGKYMWDKTKSRTHGDLVEEARRIRAMRDIHGPGVAMYIPQIEEEEDQLV